MAIILLITLVLGSMVAGLAPVMRHDTLNGGTAGQAQLAVWPLSGDVAADRSPFVATWTVDSVLDDDDSALGNGKCATAAGACTLRAAIREANLTNGSDLIIFALQRSGPQTIQLTKTLPALADATGGIMIDGYTQQGTTFNTDERVSNAQILINVVGTGPRGIDGMYISSANNTVRGLAFSNFRRSIWVSGGAAANNVIAGNFIGLNSQGLTPYAGQMLDASTEEAAGILIDNGASRTRIGGTLTPERNVISGNPGDGIYITDPGTNETKIVNNLIGLDPTGLQRRSNWGDGVDINYGARRSIIGGLAANEANVISGNQEEGVEISHNLETVATSLNYVIGNFIGADARGNGTNPSVTANMGFGVDLHDGVMDNVIGPRNVVVNNRKGGVSITYRSTNNRVMENRIGVDVMGAAAGNGFAGRTMAPGVFLKLDGGRAVIERNVIAHNAAAGVQVVQGPLSVATMSRNSFYANGGLGIVLDPTEIRSDGCAGEAAMANAVACVATPSIEKVTPTRVSGRACANCVVEVYLAEPSADYYSEGQTYLATTVANNEGEFAVNVTLDQSKQVTATATNRPGNTSPFALTLVP